MAGAIGWTRGALVQTGSLSVLSDMPAEQRLRLPDGSLLLGVHASPGRDDGQGIDSELTPKSSRSFWEAAEQAPLWAGTPTTPLTA